MEINTESSIKKIAKSPKELINKLIPVVLISIMLISGVNTISALRSYKLASAEYESLESYVTPVTTVEEVSSESEEIEEAAEEKKHPDIPMMNIDFDALTEINGDFKGWLVVPALDISYPVVQGEDNESYLHETFEHARNKAGAIFMDSFNYPDFKDLNTFIYGHSMKDKSMFGTLKTFGEDPELVESNPYIYVYTPKASFQFQIVAYYITYKDSKTYMFLQKPAEYDSYIEYIGEVNELLNSPEVDYSEYPKLITLSTCKGAHGTVNRFVVHGVLVNKVTNE